MNKKKLIPQINPENADQLWHALFAITHAVEQLELAVDVNKYRNTEMDLGHSQLTQALWNLSCI